ncbi:MAG: ABC transporter permease [Roseiarcus sp.]|jgi:putative spermidine/putrescine transport system permease protein
MIVASLLRRLPNGLLWAYSVAVFAFLVVPLLVVVPVSFSSGMYLQFPPPGLSLHWYEDYFGDPQWIDATILSLKIALCVVVLAVGIGSLAALVIVRMPFPGIGLVRLILMTPLIVPSVVVAIAVYSVYVTFHLIGSFLGIVLAHTIVALPFTVVLMVAGFQRVDRRLEEASYTMGASVAWTFRHVTLPILRPSIFAAAIFAFIASWDEIIMVIFIGGGAGTTLPLRMFNYLRTEINPTIAAVSTLLLVFAIVAFATAETVRMRGNARRAARGGAS